MPVDAVRASDACMAHAWCVDRSAHRSVEHGASSRHGARAVHNAHRTCLLIAAATSSGVEGAAPLTPDASPATKAPALDAAAAAAGVAPTAAAPAASAAGSSVFCFLASCSLIALVSDGTAKR